MPDEPVIHASYGPLRLEPPADKKPRVSVWKTIGDGATWVRTQLINLSVILALAALAALTVAEFLRNPVIIEEIGLPPPLTERGYNGNVVAHRLWDAITEIQTEAGTIKEQASLTTLGRQLDVVEPGTGLSLQGLTQMLRALFGRPQTRIAGEVICETSACDWSGLRLRLRIFTADGMQIRDLGLLGGHGTRDYFHRAAVETMKMIDPYSLAAYYYDRDRRAGEEIARHLIATRHRHRAWAANLLGNALSGTPDAAIAMYARSIKFAKEDEIQKFVLPWIGWGNRLSALGHHEEALEKYREATELDPDFAYAWVGWGSSLGSLGRHEEALRVYRRATEFHPYYVNAWNEWGNRLSALERYDEAIDKYRRATELDPNYAHPWNNWGNSLNALGRYQEALEKFSRATELDLEDPFSWNGWGNGLYALGQYEEAIEKYRRATQLSPEYAYAWNGIGNALSNLGRYDEAFVTFKDAIGLVPTFSVAAQNWGLYLTRYLDSDEELRCQRVAVHGSTFLATAGPLLEGNPRRSEVEALITSCESATVLNGPR